MDLARDIVIVGLSIRTSPETAMKDIPALWARFAAGDGPVYAVYCDYESDSNGPYTMVLGTESTPMAAGMRRVTIPHGRYETFRAEGDPAEVVWKTWMKINSSGIERRYIADFEKCLSPTSIEISVGIR